MLITVAVFTELWSEYPYANTLFKSNGISQFILVTHKIYQ